MQFWFKIENESELKNLYFMMKSGFTTNVVGPFLSQGFDLDFMTVFPKITFWDFKIASNDNHFSILESLSFSRNLNMKSLIDVSETSADFLIRLRSSVNPDNICLYDRHCHRSDIRFYNLLNMDFHSLLFDLNDTEDKRIESRNYYMKKSRIGYSITTDILDESIRPDFMMMNLEQYERMI